MNSEMRPLKWSNRHTLFILIIVMLLRFNIPQEIAEGLRVDKNMGWPFVWYVTHEMNGSFWIEYKLFSLIGNLVLYGIAGYIIIQISTMIRRMIEKSRSKNTAF